MKYIQNVKRLLQPAVILLISSLIALTLVPGCGQPTLLTQSSAGLVVKLTLDDLTARADSILVGEVTGIASYQEANIYTLVTLSVEQTIKGESEGEVSIRIPGGEVNGQTLWVEDTPSFQLGERAVVFLGEGEGIFSIVGGFQGKFTIDNNNMVSSNVSLTEFIDQIKGILATQ